MFAATLVLWGSFLLCSATSDSRLAEPLPNAQHIFNAIHSSMRQWGSSLNHNGMSFFFATVPQGVHLHHGSPYDTRVEGMEWLAFEPEHAIRFAWNVFECNKSKTALSGQKPLRWSFPQYLNDPSPFEAPQHGDQQVLKPPPKPPPFCLKPGYLHTYATSRDLNLLYIDGQAAAKSLNGTLDSQDYILRHGFPKHEFFDDWGRANDLCQLARSTWEGKVDGFIRMEHGFEMILCDFNDLDVVSILDAEQPNSSPFSTRSGYKMAGEHFNFFSAITSRYFDIGGDRVKLYYDHFVTAYNYPEIDFFPFESAVPRLTLISNHSAQQILSDITSLILSHGRKAPASAANVNWQSITTLLTTRYSRHLQLLTTPNAYSNATTLAYALSLLFSPYISHRNRNDTLEIHRCVTAFLPYHLHSLPHSEQSLAQRAFLTVAERACSTLHSIFSNEDLTLSEQQNRLKYLMNWLQWTDFKYCQPSCALDEICVTAIWPYGKVEDIERPSCENASWITRRFGDWDMGHLGGGWW